MYSYDRNTDLVTFFGTLYHVFICGYYIVLYATQWCYGVC